MNRYPETFIINSSYKQEVTKMRIPLRMKQNKTKQKNRHIKSAFVLYFRMEL